MNNPVFEALLNARVTDIVDPPRSWGREEKERFLQLPPDLQHYYAEREKQRDRTVRLAQNEAAEARKSLADVEAKLAACEARLAKIEERDAEVKGAVA